MPYKIEQKMHGRGNRQFLERVFQKLMLNFEYFHGDNGAGIGASHQTGWTGLVAKLIQQFAEYEGQHKTPTLVEFGQFSRTRSP